MERATWTGLGTLSLLGVRKEAPGEKFLVVYHLDFITDRWLSQPDDSFADRIIAGIPHWIRSEKIGEGSFLLRETLSEDVRNPKGFLRNRLVFLGQSYEQLRHDLAKQAADSRLLNACDAFQETTMGFETFGIKPEPGFDNSHLTVCPNCRFWSAERQARRRR